MVEGVETAEEGRFFYDLGAMRIQGFLFAKPVPIDSFSNFSLEPLEDKNSLPEKGLYEELTDPSSPSFLLFNTALSLQGVYLFNSDGFFLIKANRALGNTLSFGGNETNRLDTIDESDREAFVEYLKKISKGGFNIPYFEYRHTTRDGVANLRCRSYLLKNTEKGAILYFEAVPLSLTSRNSEERISLKNLASLYDHDPTATACISETTKRFIYLNAGFKQFFPEAEYDGSCQALSSFAHDCKRCSLFGEKEESMTTMVNGRAYLHRSNQVVLDSGLGRLVRIQSAAGSDPIASTVCQGVFVSNVATMILDFSKDEWIEISASEDKNFNRTEGKGVGREFEQLSKRYFKGRFLERAEQELSFSHLLELSKTSSNFVTRYYSEMNNHFYQFSVSFLHNPNQAVIFVSNCDEDSLKDYDGLTGLLARGIGISHIEEQLKTEYSSCPTLVLFDLDGFKTINDKYGHPAGDKVLAKVGSYLIETDKMKILSPTRLGGDEFVFLTSSSTTEEVSLALNGLFEDIRGQIGIDDNISCSVGTAIVPVDGSNFDELYHLADERLYESKRKRTKRIG